MSSQEHAGLWYLLYLTYVPTRTKVRIVLKKNSLVFSSAPLTGKTCREKEENAPNTANQRHNQSIKHHHNDDDDNKNHNINLFFFTLPISIEDFNSHPGRQEQNTVQQQCNTYTAWMISLHK